MKPTVKPVVFFALTLSLFFGLPVSAQDAPASTPPATPAAPRSSPSNTMRRAVEWKHFEYTCEKGAKLSVYLRDQMAKIRFGDKTYFMKQVPSADGARYSDGKVSWWDVRSGGFLQEDSQDGDGAMLTKECKVDKPAAAGP